jgi:plasmid stabilization system protein ParE
MKVTFSGPSRTDLREIAARISADNPARAPTFVRELRERCVELDRMQLMFPIVPGRRDGMRRRVVGSYSIFYLTRPTGIVIARVLHNARDVDSLLRER